jgi:hypothetical protein
MEVGDYAALQRDLEVLGLPADARPYLALFSRSGFAPRLRQLAPAQQPRRLLLVGLKEMYKA